MNVQIPSSPPQLNPNAAAMLHMFSQGIVNEFLTRFPQLAVLDPNAQVSAIRYDESGSPIGLQTNTWAGLIAEHIDTMKIMIAAMDELREAFEAKKRR